MYNETEKLIIRKKQIVVTRHRALVAYLLDRDIIKEGDIKIIEHADYKDVEGKDVIGVLPLQLASYAKSITEVSLKLTADMRGKELTFDEVEKVADTPVQYVVRETMPKDSIDYYLEILRGYSEEDYTSAKKYHSHVYKNTKYWKSYEIISKARVAYIDITNALYGIFDIHTMEFNHSTQRKFCFGNKLGLTYFARLIYLDDYYLDEDENEVYKYTEVVSKDFSREGVLKFINELMDMCI